MKKTLKVLPLLCATLMAVGCANTASMPNSISLYGRFGDHNYDHDVQFTTADEGHTWTLDDVRLEEGDEIKVRMDGSSETTWGYTSLSESAKNYFIAGKDDAAEVKEKGLYDFSFNYDTQLISVTYEEIIELEDVYISNKDELAELIIDEEVKIKAGASPSTIGATLVYESSDPTIASVNASGVVKGIAPGKVTITVSATYNGVTMSDSVEMTVIDTFFIHNVTMHRPTDWTHEMDETNPHVEYAGAGFLFYRHAYSTRWYAQADIAINKIYDGDQFAKIGIFSSEELTDQNGMFYYFDAPLFADGSGVNFWNATGFVDKIDGQFGSEHNWHIARSYTPAELGLEEGKNVIAYGDTFSMGLLRDGAYYHTYLNGVYYYSFKSNLLDPDQPSYPSISGNNVGATVSNYFFYKDNDPALVAKLEEVNTKAGVQSVVIEGPEEVVVSTKGSLKLEATITPATAVENKINWKSDNEAVATVDQRGNVTPHSTGKATITASSAYPYSESVSDSVVVDVRDIELITGIEANDSYTLDIGEKVDIDAKPIPAAALNEFRYEVSNSDIVTVSDEGVLEAKKAGTAEITITSVQDTKITKTVSVTVLSGPFTVSTPKFEQGMPLVDFSNYHNETDPYVEVKQNPDVQGHQNGLFVAYDTCSTKWAVEWSWSDLTFFNDEAWSKMIIGSVTEDGSTGSLFFADTPRDRWWLAHIEYQDVGVGVWKGNYGDNWLVGDGFAPGKGALTGSKWYWDKQEALDEGLTDQSPVMCLVRDGATYHFFVNGFERFSYTSTNGEQDKPTTPYLGSFNAAYKIKDYKLVTDSVAVDAILGNADPITGIECVSSLTLEEGQSYELTPAPVPATSSPAFTYSVDNDNVTVSESGIVKAVKEGSSVITITSVQDPRIKTTVTVTVNMRILNTEMPTFEGQNNVLVDWTNYYGEDGYVEIKQNPDAPGMQNGLFVSYNVLSTKWAVEWSWDEVTFFNDEKWSKMIIGSITEDGSTGTLFFADTPRDHWWMGYLPYSNVGVGVWKGNHGDNWLVGDTFAPGKDALAGAKWHWDNPEITTEDLTTQSPVFRLIRDGATYYFYVNGALKFSYTSTNGEANVASTPYLGSFSAAYKIRDYALITDSDAIDALIKG